MFFSTSEAAGSFLRLLVARRRRRWIALGFVAALLAGCATGDVSLVVPVSGGGKFPVPIARGLARPTEIDGFTLKAPLFTLSDEKTRLVYLFEFSDPKGRALQSVRVEDISDAKPLLLLEEAMPTSNQGLWRGVSRPVSPGEEGLKWIYSIDNTVRVFRFTIVTADGRSVVANQGALFPNVFKIPARQAFGEKY
jgi:hypothetical protein